MTIQTPRLRRTAFSILVATVLLVSMSAFAVGYFWDNSSFRNLVAGPLEFSRPEQLDIKLDHFSSQTGMKIALVGDSFVFGGTMADSVGPNWRAQSLDVKLAQCLSAQTGNMTHVANFGNNGLLPADFSQLTTKLLANGADLILVNVNPRSMSLDFNVPDKQYRYHWLREGPLQLGGFEKIDAVFDYIHQTIVGSAFDIFAQQGASSLASIFGIKDTKFNNAAEFGNLNVLLKLKRRFTTATYNTKESIQASKLADLLANKRVYGFETAINPNFLRSVMSVSKKEELDEGLRRLSESRRGHVFDAPSDLSENDFLDLMHVSPSGYKKYATVLCQRIRDIKPVLSR